MSTYDVWRIGQRRPDDARAPRYGSPDYGLSDAQVEHAWAKMAEQIQRAARDDVTGPAAMYERLSEPGAVPRFSGNGSLDGLTYQRGGEDVPYSQAPRPSPRPYSGADAWLA